MRKKTLCAALALAVLCGLFTFAGLCGCGAEGRLYGKAEVLSRVAEAIPNDSYELVGVEKKNDVTPREEVYTFAATDRDLTFRAVNTRQKNYFGYNRVVLIDYDDVVRALYREDAEKALADKGLDYEFLTYDDVCCIYYSSFGELADIADAIAACNEIYSAEEKYGSAEWMRENPFADFRLQFRGAVSDSDNVKRLTARYAADGGRERGSEYILDYLTFCHAQAVNEGRITDAATPQEALERGHRGTLDSIYINGINITDACCESADEGSLKNRARDNCDCNYSYGTQSYMIPLDVGCTDKDYAPRMMETIADTLGFGVEVGSGSGRVAWTYAGCDWEIRAKEKDDHVVSAEFRRNGEAFDVTLLTVDSEYSTAGATYLIGVTADDFADIFCLDYTVDEEGGAIYFTSKTE